MAALINCQIASIVPPILTCLVGRHLGSSPDPLVSYELRRLAASVLSSVSKKYSKSSHMLKPRLARTCLKHFLDPTKPLGANYGGIIGLQAIGGPEIVRALIVPNLKDYEDLVREAIDAMDETKRNEGEMVIKALLAALLSLEDEIIGTVNGLVNGHAGEMKKELGVKIGDLFAERVLDLGKPKLVKAIMEC